ncbi:hypothetical protein TRIP_C90470 [Candidatus Zixiibacteriota bacterium]|nr:hypothetical protein TRIP_C90470 [candidate division Zixibacteria bacterium]
MSAFRGIREIGMGMNSSAQFKDQKIYLKVQNGRADASKFST